MSAAEKDAIAQFAMITAYQNETHIANFLKLQKWDLEMAVNIFFSEGMPSSVTSGAAGASPAPKAATPAKQERIVPSELKIEIVVGGSVIQVRQGDLTTETVDCIVNPANNRLKHGAGIAADIIRRGGDMIQILSDIHISQSGPLDEGAVVSTNAGELKTCQHILHAVGPMWSGGAEGEEVILGMTVTNCLNKAAELGCRSIALPAISSGIFGFPKNRCCTVILTTLVQFLERGSSPVKTIKLMANDAETVKCFETACQDKRAEDARREQRKRRLQSRKRRAGSFRVLCLGDNHTLGFHGVDKHTMYGLGNQSTGDESQAKYCPYSQRLMEMITKELKGKVPCELVTMAANGAQVAHSTRAVADLEQTYMTASVSAAGETKVAAAEAPNPAFSVVVVWTGANDILQGKPAPQVFAEISELHRRLCAPEGLNCCVSVVCLLPPFDMSEWVPRWGAKAVSAQAAREINDSRGKLNALLRDFARDTKRPLVGLDTAIFQDATQSVMWDDAVHYTPMGYRKIGEVIYHVLDAAELFDDLCA